jgi:hypothetical protein
LYREEDEKLSLAVIGFEDNGHTFWEAASLNKVDTVKLLRRNVGINGVDADLRTGEWKFRGKFRMMTSYVMPNFAE